MKSAPARFIVFAFLVAVAGCGGVPGDSSIGNSGAAQEAAQATLHVDAGEDKGDKGDKSDKSDGGIDKEDKDGGVEKSHKEDGGKEDAKEDGGKDDTNSGKGKGEKEDGGE